MLTAIILFILLGLITGLLSGLLGIGGNVIAIPLLTMILKYELNFPEAIAMPIATGTCMGIMIFTTISSASVHYKLKNIDWGFYKQLAGFIILGCILGAVLNSFINAIILEKIFGVFVLYIASNMILSKKVAYKSSDAVLKLSLLKRIIYGIAIGFKSGVLGIGGGAMLIPLLFALKYQSKMVLGTTAAFSFTIASFTTIVFLMHHPHLNVPIKHLFGFIYLPALACMAPCTFMAARLGANLSAKIPHKLARGIFATLLVVMGIDLLI